MGASIGQMAAPRYYEQQTHQDYHAAGSLRMGEYFGRGAKALGLLGKAVVLSVCLHLSRGFAPDGVTKLSQTAGTPNRFEGPDIAFNPKKWVSALWASEPDASQRRRIEEVVLAAAKKGLQYLEDNALFSRRGKGGSRTEQCFALVATLWLHSTSRCNDPQLHVHACVYNQVRRPDGTWGTILGVTRRSGQSHAKAQSAIHEHKLAAGKVFDQAVERGMRKLGYRLERSSDGQSFDAPVPASLIAAFSTRRRQIVQHLDSTGGAGAAAAAHAALVTRPRKRHEPHERLLDRWQRVAVEHGFDPEELRKVPTHDEVRSLPQRISEEAGDRTRGNGSSGAREDSDDGARTLGGRRQKARGDADDWSTLRDAARVAHLLKRSAHGRADITRANVSLAATLRHLSAQERSALTAITRGRGSIQCLGGAAGERVPEILRAARQAWQLQGHRVVLAATSRAAAQRYEDETGIHSISATGLLRGLSTNRGLLRGYASAVSQSLKLGTGFHSTSAFLNCVLSASGRWIRLDAKSVVIVDRPDTLELRERAELLRNAKRAGARVIFMDARRDASGIREALLRPRVAAQSDNQHHRRLGHP